MFVWYRFYAHTHSKVVVLPAARVHCSPGCSKKIHFTTTTFTDIKLREK